MGTISEFNRKRYEINFRPKRLGSFDKNQLKVEEIGYYFSLSPDGSMLAWCAKDSGIILERDLESSRIRELMLPKKGGGNYKKYPYESYFIGFSNDTANLISILRDIRTGDFEYAIWETAAWKLLYTGVLGDDLGGVGSVAFSSQKDVVAIGSNIRDIYLADIQKSQVGILSGHGPSLVPAPITHKVGFVAFSPDNKRLFSAGEDGEVLAWNLSRNIEGGCAESLYSHGYAVDCGALSPDGALLATSNPFSFEDEGGSIVIWDVNAGRMISEIKEGAYDLSFVDNRFLISFLTEHDKNDKPIGENVRLWDVKQGLIREEKMEKRKMIKSSFFQSNLSHGGKYLIGQVFDNHLEIWQLYELQIE